MSDRERSIHLSPVQVVASALASVTAAVLASFFGVAGTVIGAGVVSAAASIGNAVYAYWIRSTHRAIRETIPSALRQPGSTVRTLVGTGARVSGGSSGGSGFDGADADPANTNEVPAFDASLDVPPPGPLGSPPSPLGRPPTTPGAPQSPGGPIGRAGNNAIERPWAAALRVAGSLRWRNIAVATVVVFGLSMAGVTAVEALAKQPLSGIVGGSVPTGATTSVGGLVGGGQSSKPSPTSPSSSSDSTTTNPQTTTPNGSSTTTTSPSSTTTTTPGRSTTTTPSLPTSPSVPPTSSGTTPGSSGSSSGATSSSSGMSSSSGASSSGGASGANPSGGSTPGTQSAGG